MRELFTDYVLPVPRFARISDYFGLWAMHVDQLTAFAELVSRTDMAQHMAAFRPPQQQEPTIQKVAAANGKSVAVVRLAGTMMKSAGSFGGSSTVQVRKDLRAAADPDVSAILMAIDSPGGAISGTADLASDVNRARRKKPVWAHIDDLGASAAYWVASQADQIYANSPTALVGSIGTYGSVTDLSGALEKGGVKVRVFRSGPLKGAGAVPGDPLTDEQAAHLQRTVDLTQQHFDAAVKSGRGLTAAQLDAVRSGGVFLAQEAKELKLIDGIRPLETTLAALAAAK
jgi:signal peptide peptidase SppA